jgi:hypothetical protein
LSGYEVSQTPLNLAAEPEGFASLNSCSSPRILSSLALLASAHKLPFPNGLNWRQAEIQCNSNNFH